MVKITAAALITDGVKAIESYLDSTIAASFAASVYCSWPHRAQSYPFVVVKPPIMSQNSMSFRGLAKGLDVSFPVYVYEDNAPGIDSIGEAVFNALSDSTAISAYWQQHGLMFKDCEVMDQRKLQIGQKYVYEKPMMARFRWYG